MFLRRRKRITLTLTCRRLPRQQTLWCRIQTQVSLVQVASETMVTRLQQPQWTRQPRHPSLPTSFNISFKILKVQYCMLCLYWYTSTRRQPQDFNVYVGPPYQDSILSMTEQCFKCLVSSTVTGILHDCRVWLSPWRKRKRCAGRSGLNYKTTKQRTSFSVVVWHYALKVIWWT